MNSVLECADHIIFLHKGRKTWEGDRQQILKSENEDLNELVYATRHLQQYRDQAF
jgi:phospholipid/cholesterol/gamma-HCH transport system ATP-binding protein